MSEYLQDPLSDQSFEQLSIWLEQDKGQSEVTHWLIGDGLFAPNLLTRHGVLDWQPVFTHEPMSQYEEMGLFIAAIPNEPLMLKVAFDWMRQFDGLPMFSIIATRQSEAELKQFLTWLSDAYTDDGMSLYLRIGDTRCLPYIISNFDDEQRHVLGAMMSRWTWFERDGSLKHRLQSSATTVSDSAIEIMKQPFTINEQQYVKLIEHGEADLIYNTLDMDDVIFVPEIKQSTKHKQIVLLVAEAKKRNIKGVSDICEFVATQLIEYKYK